MSRRVRIALLAGGIAVLLGAAYVLGLVAFVNQRDNGSKAFAIDSGPNGIAVDARVTGVDPATDAMTMRLEFVPIGRYARTQVALSRPVELFINTASGRTDIHYAAGQVISPTDVTVALNGGELLDYPFDKYSADLLVYAQKGPMRIPVSMQVTTGSTGFTIDTSRRVFEGQGYAHFQLRRTTTTVAFAVFIMVVFWLTALSALWLAFVLGTGRRKWEAGFTGFFAALLFAFPTVRNSLPGSPPIGSLVDYLAFFWAEGIVALALIGVIVSLCRRLLPGSRPPDG